MNLSDVFTRKGIIFLVLFAVISFIALNMNFSPLLGTENQNFTFFQFFAPIAAGFLGPVVGVLSILLTEVANFFIAGKSLDLINIFRLTPMLFAAYYFGVYGKKKNLVAAIPIICMALFMLHPVGQQVWFYSLYWLIPLGAKIFKNNLFLRSLGTTFTAHAIGSVIFLYTIPTDPGLWAMLIPIVAFERGLFASGIAVSYIGFNTVLSKLESILPKKLINIERKYVLSKNLFRASA